MINIILFSISIFFWGEFISICFCNAISIALFEYCCRCTKKCRVILWFEIIKYCDVFVRNFFDRCRLIDFTLGSLKLFTFIYWISQFEFFELMLVLTRSNSLTIHGCRSKFCSSHFNFSLHFFRNRLVILFHMKSVKFCTGTTANSEIHIKLV